MTSFPNSNDLFYATEIVGTINEVKSLPKANFYKIDKQWYLIRDEVIDYLSMGDSVYKEPESYYLQIYDSHSMPKWKGEVKYLDFKIFDVRPKNGELFRYNITRLVSKGNAHASYYAGYTCS